jgi:hypothetical protein
MSQNIYNPSLPSISLSASIKKGNGDDSDNYQITIGSGSAKTMANGKFVPVYVGTNATRTLVTINFSDFGLDVYIKNWEIDFGDGQKMSGVRKIIKTTVTTSATAITATLGSNAGLISDKKYFISSDTYLPAYNQLRFTSDGTTATGTISSSIKAISDGINNLGITAGSESCLITEASVDVYHRYSYNNGDTQNASMPITLVGIDNYNRRITSRSVVYPKIYS